MTRKNRHFIQSLARGFSVLQAFSAQRPRLSLTEIASLTGMNLTAVQRITDTLMSLGFLGRNRHKEFFLEPAVMSLGFSFLHGSQLKMLAERRLTAFGERVNKTVNLAVLEGDEIVFLHRKESQRFLKYDLRAGSRLPSYCTASGKVLLAAMSDGELRRRLNRLEFEGLTRHTLTDPEKLWADLMETRRRGYAVCDRELSLSLYSVGVPLINDEEAVVAAINMSVPTEEACGEGHEANVAQFVELGRTLSSSLGYNGPYPRVAPPNAPGDKP